MKVPIQILTDMKDYTEHQNIVLLTLEECGFDMISDQKPKVYFPSKCQDFQLDDNKKILLLKSKDSS